MGNHLGNPNFRQNKNPDMTISIAAERREAERIARELLRAAGEQMMRGGRPKAPDVSGIVDAEQMAVVGAGLIAIANGR